MRKIYNWIERYLLDPEIMVLWVSLLVIILIVALMGKMLMPVFVSIVFAYLLQWAVVRLESLKVPHVLAVLIVYLTFIGLFVFAIFGVLPLLWTQLKSLFNQLPTMLEKSKYMLMHLPENYPSYISPTYIQDIMGEAKVGLTKNSQIVLASTLAWISNLIVIGIYFILVPLLVYFFLMDRQLIINWIKQYIPKKRQLTAQVWHEVNEQIGNYIRGKVLEIITVSIVCYIAFALMGLDYSVLLASLVGISVIIPYVGAVLVTIPVMIIAFLEWGLVPHFYYFILVYAIIIAIDANVLVPLLFAEAVKLHPIAIILAVLIFGGLWGFWGIFFAIPLASLVKAILHALRTSPAIQS